MTTPAPAQDDPRDHISAFVKSAEKLGLLSSSTITDDCSNTVPCGMSFYQANDTTYALLEPLLVPFNDKGSSYVGLDGLTYGKRDYNYEDYFLIHNVSLLKPMTSHKKRMNLLISGLVDRIELNDFPYGQYTLSINGHCVATAKYNKCTRKHIFDFTDENNRSQELDVCINVFKYPNEPSLSDRQNYLNFDRVDTTEILYSTELNDIHHITFHGHMIFNDSYVEKSKEIIVSPYTYILRPFSIIESIDVKTRGNGQLIVKIDEDDVGLFQINSPKIRIKFNNPHKVYNQIPMLQYDGISAPHVELINQSWGRFNHFLSEEININTVNLCSKAVSFIPLGCTIDHVVLHRYVLYRYPERVPL